jgi:alpha-D-xyloside xylohydrolase
MMRALLVDSPDDPAAWGEELAYRLGTDLLVAPMTDPDGSRTVYLPTGESWVDSWTGEVFAGGRHVRISQPLDRIPLLVRHGALIPVVAGSDTVGDAPFGEITLLSFGAEPGRVLVYDVDGTTEVTAVRDGDTFAVTTAGPARVGRVEFPPVDAAAAPPTVTVNGAAA